MASLVNLFRSSARHSSRLRSTLPTATGVARSRGIITAPPEAEGLGDASADLDNITRTFEEAEEGVHTAKQPFFKPFYPHYFTKPSDFSKEARLETGAFRRSKRPYLGPGRAEAEAQDVFRQLNIDPLQEATNSRLLSAFVTDMGKIKQRPVTNLTWRSQRKLGKAVRRARMMGIIPQLSKKMLSQSYTPGMVRPSMK